MAITHGIVTWHAPSDARPRNSSTVLGFDGEASAEYYVNEAGQWFAGGIGQIDDTIIEAWAYMPAPPLAPRMAEHALFAEKPVNYEPDGDVLWAAEGK